MKRWGWLSLILSMGLVAVSIAAPVQQAEQTKPLKVLEVTKRVDGLSIQFDVETPDLITVETEDGSALVADYSSVVTSVEEDGMPLLPAISEFFRLPQSGGVTVNLINSEFETLTNVDYATYFDAADQDFLGISDETVDAWYPENIVDVTEPAIFRDFRISSLITYPVQVNPARREVRIYSNVEVDLDFNNNDNRNALTEPVTSISELFLPWYRQFLDWNEAELDEFEVYRGGVQVVAKLSAVNENSFQDWLQWKKQKGWDIELLTDSDCSWTRSGIQAELESRWNSAERKFDYVVIVGDNTGSYSTPSGGNELNGHGDHGYVRLAGNDWIPEAAIGRISVESGAQLHAYVQKVLSYEKHPPEVEDPNHPENSWYKKGLVSAGSNSSGLSTIQLGRYARYGLFDLGYTRVDTAWYNDGQGDVNNRNRNTINAGVSFFSYRGYLSSGMPPSTISALTNTNKLPMVLDITCGTGNWYDGTGYNEAWMRAGSASQPRGGIGAISTATSSTHTRFNNSLAGGAIESGIIMHNPAAGDYLLGSKINLYKSYNGFDNSGVSNFSTWCNLMGDPLVWIWSDVPQAMIATHPSVIPIGTNSVEIQVQQISNNIEGAWVTLYKVDAQDNVISHGISDENGNVILETPFEAAGTVVLTITKQNFKPYIAQIDVEDGSIVAITDYTVTDNGTEGTSGNGNGIPEAGETIGLTFTLENMADVTRTDVSLSLSSTDDLMDITTAEATFGALDADESATATSMIIIEVDDLVQDNWITNFDVDIEHEEGNFSDIFRVKFTAPKYSIQLADLNGILEPGTTVNASLLLKNVGGGNGLNGTATFISLDPYLTVPVNEALLPPIMSGQTGETGEFTIAAHPSAFKGYPAAYKVILESNAGQSDTTYGTIHLGNRSTTDPIGPDGYGYFAFDNTDTDYDLCPTYDWIEINPNAPGSVFDGTRLNINDAGEDQEHTQVMSLPFTFQYYGEEFGRITVTGNGFIAMGDQSDMSTARNWSIPSPLGADYMIAPYWDDRLTNSGGVYTYYDAAGGRYIIEWDNTEGFSGWSGGDNHFCTFQLIIYDQVGGHITMSGDNEFQFQYKSMDHSTGAGYDNPYFTTGIENGNQLDGLLYSYWNTPVPGAAAVNNQRAILFTTLTELITGQIAGQVTYFTGGEPVVGVTVETEDGVFSTVTNDEGNFFLDRVVIGQHYLVVKGDGLNPIVSELITVNENDVTEIDFQVTQPMFDLSETGLYIEVDPASSTTHDLTVTNEGDGEMEFDVTVDFWGPVGEDDYRGNHPSTGLDEIWDLLYGFEFDGSEIRNRGFAFRSNTMWVCGSNNNDSSEPNRIYKYDTRGELITSFDQPVPNFGSVGFYSITFDEDYMYSAENGVMYQMSIGDDDITVVDSWNIPINPARNITYDADNDLFWMGDYATPIYGLNRSGEIVHEYNTGLTVRGLSWYPGDDTDHNLYIISQEFANTTANLSRLNTSNGQVNYIRSFECGDSYVSDIAITYHWNPMVWAMVLMFDAGGSMRDFAEVYELANNAAWIDIDVENATVEPGASQEIVLTFDALDLPDGIYSSWLKFDHNAIGGQTYLPVDLGIGVGVEDEDVNPLVPTQWSFDGVYPNPFNPTTSVKFGLPQSALVQAKLFNILGQEVTTLMNRNMPAGHHTLSINGENLSSGVYFLKFNAGPMEEAHKVILLK